jgi:hypothetical protein
MELAVFDTWILVATLAVHISRGTENPLESDRVCGARLRITPPGAGDVISV